MDFSAEVAPHTATAPPARDAAHGEGRPAIGAALMANGWWLTNGPSHPRIRGRALQRMRADLFRTSPWCVLCLLRGIFTKATIRDHIIPLAEGGVDDNSNCHALCQTCSDRKTRDETVRGQRRSQEE